jgi:multicomponent Na+:H+ antiporter subunit D
VVASAGNAYNAASGGGQVKERPAPGTPLRVLMIAPTSFFEQAATFEPYNAHFIRDLGAFQIGLGAVLLLAAFSRDALLVALAGTTILLASLIALRQDNLKARLAYSTIGQLSYIVLGIALLAPSALVGGVFHMVAHAAMKITLFFCAGAIYVHTKRTKVSELDGIGKQMPVTMTAFAIGSLGMAGMPAIAGFVSKWHLVQGTTQAGQTMLFALLILSGLLSAAYLWPIVARAFFLRSPSFPRLQEAPILLVAPLVLTGLLSISLGLFPDGFFHFYQLSSEIAFGILNGGLAE